MRWTPRGRSRNLEDRRGEGAGGGFRLGGRGRPPRLGLGGFVVVLALSLYFGQDFFALLGEAGPTGVSIESGPAPLPGSGPGADPAEEPLVEFVSFVLDDAQTTWARLLPPYREARLVLFRGAVSSACGHAESAMGPFYCPLDQKVYIDLGFYEELQRRFGAPGDFAQAYVLAHEIGHHVQNLLGIESRVRSAREARPDVANALSVRMELQADCFAGVWGYATAEREILEAGDVEEALRAAAAIGDDRIQEMATGTLRPESFTHGTSEQRVRWFRRGLASGDPEDCDTFASLD
jgi:predicted metalloprotease